MPKKFFKKFMPDPHAVMNNKYLRALGPVLQNPNLWHFNRRSVSGGFALGLFNAFIPVPSQMLLSAIGAVIFRVNLPIAVGTVWITNPVTMPPVFYFTYRVGTWILGTPEQAVKFELTTEWLLSELDSIWQPFLLGSLVTAAVAALLGYVIVRGMWRLHIVQHIKQRRLRRKEREASARGL